MTQDQITVPMLIKVFKLINEDLADFLKHLTSG